MAENIKQILDIFDIDTFHLTASILLIQKKYQRNKHLFVKDKNFETTNSFRSCELLK